MRRLDRATVGLVLLVVVAGLTEVREVVLLVEWRTLPPARTARAKALSVVTNNPMTNKVDIRQTLSDLVIEFSLCIMITILSRNSPLGPLVPLEIRFARHRPVLQK